jgi:hypothetical protein
MLQLENVALDKDVKDKLVSSIQTGNIDAAEMETLTHSFYNAVNTGNMSSMLFLIWHIDSLKERKAQRKELSYISYWSSLYIAVPLGISSAFVLDQFIKSPVSVSAGVGSALLVTAANYFLHMTNRATDGFNYITNKNVSYYTPYNISDNVKYAVNGVNTIMSSVITNEQRLSICIIFVMGYAVLMCVIIDRINAFRRIQRRSWVMTSQVNYREPMTYDLVSYLTHTSRPMLADIAR